MRAVWMLVALQAGCLGTFIAPPRGDTVQTADPTPQSGDSSTMAPDLGSVDFAQPAQASLSASDLALASARDLGAAPSDLAATAASTDLAIACDKLQSTATLSSPSGHHNAGAECQGCHAPGNGAPTFYLGGTLYSTAMGGTAVAGGTIEVSDASGKSVKIVSANNGNFWTTTPLTFPIQVAASLCPARVPMVAAVATQTGANGACNNCHNSTMRVHVP
jgi:hypothetical protein